MIGKDPYTLGYLILLVCPREHFKPPAKLTLVSIFNSP